MCLQGLYVHRALQIPYRSLEDIIRNRNSTMSNSKTHIVFFPITGMGHLTPFLRLASILSSRKCMITLITTHPIIFPDESDQISVFFSSHPNINRLDFNITGEKSSGSPTDDVFILQLKAISSSIHLLPTLLSSLPDRVSAIFSDFVVASTLSQLSTTLNIPNFIVSTTSARCYSTVAYLPTLLSYGSTKINDDLTEEIKIPSLAPLPKSLIPPSWLDNSPLNSFLKEYLIPNALALPRVDGLLLNSFDWFEPETISSLLDNKVLSDLPPLYPIGPLKPYKSEKKHDQPWLDSKPRKSVVYINLGKKTALSTNQIREIGKGLEISGHLFLWVLGETINDHEFKELLKRTKNKGTVVKELVHQAGILTHPAIGGFFNQCDWDSVTESVQEGVPMLAWPQHGDHRMNAEVVKKAGFGIWVKEWGWGGEKVVESEEIAANVKELMEDGFLKENAKKAKAESRRAYEICGSSENALMKVIHLLKQKNVG